jgi:hypothetical protein
MVTVDPTLDLTVDPALDPTLHALFRRALAPPCHSLWHSADSREAVALSADSATEVALTAPELWEGRLRGFYIEPYSRERGGGSV